MTVLFLFWSLDPNDQKSLEGMQKMEKEESPTDATVELDGDDMEGSGEEGDLEGSDSEAAQWADQEQWFGMQWPSALAKRLLSFSTSEKTSTLLDCGVWVQRC